MARPDKFTKAQIAEALTKARGLRTVAAKELGCSHNTMARYINRYPDLAETVEVSDVARYELAVSKLDEKLDLGDPWAIATTIRMYTDRERLRIAAAANGEAAEWRRRARLAGIDPDVLADAFRQTYRELLARRPQGGMLTRSLAAQPVDAEGGDDGE